MFSSGTSVDRWLVIATWTCCTAGQDRINAEKVVVGRAGFAVVSSAVVVGTVGKADWGIAGWGRTGWGMIAVESVTAFADMVRTTLAT